MIKRWIVKQYRHWCTVRRYRRLRREGLCHCQATKRAWTEIRGIPMWQFGGWLCENCKDDLRE